MSTTIIAGGAPVSVTDHNGETTEVLVRLLKIKEFPEYFSRAEDEEALAAFVTGRDPEFVGQLTADSVLTICEVAHDLNFQNACRWANRRANLGEALLPVAQKGMKMQQTLGNYAPAAPSSSARPSEK